MRHCLKLLAVGFAALSLMNFDLRDEETDVTELPDVSFFGDMGDTPNVDGLKGQLLFALQCGSLNVQVAGDGPPPALVCANDEGETYPVNATLTVTPLPADASTAMPGMTCSRKRSFPLDLDGMVQQQECNVNGHRYELHLEVTKGVPI